MKCFHVFKFAWNQCLSGVCENRATVQYKLQKSVGQFVQAVQVSIRAGVHHNVSRFKSANTCICAKLGMQLAFALCGGTAAFAIGASGSDQS